MNITIIAMGHKLPSWAEQGTDEYLKRFPADWKIQLKALRTIDANSAPLPRILETEGQKILAAVPTGAELIVLDERGKDLTTQQCAHKMQLWRDQGKPVCFVIGSANGLAPEVKSQASLLLRLSSMTLPHALARILLIEQIYRVWSVLSAHPYHRS